MNSSFWGNVLSNENSAALLNFSTGLSHASFQKSGMQPDSLRAFAILVCTFVNAEALSAILKHLWHEGQTFELALRVERP
jgi:hypothetical protein